MGGSSPPAAPDPYKVSDAQTQSNITTARNTAQLNALDLFSPYGSTKFNYDPSDPRNVGQDILVPTGESLNFSPDVLNFVNQQLNSSNAMAGLTMRQIGQLPTAPFDPNSIGSTSDIAHTMYEQQLGLLQPQFDQAKTQLDQQLTDRGIPMGSDIWNKEQDRYASTKGQTLNQLALQSQEASGNEYQRLLGNALNLYELPYSQLSMLEGGTPSVTTPQFANQTPVGISGTDVSGNVWNAYNAQLNAYNSQQQGMGSALGAIGSIGGALIGKSSRDYKENIEPADGEMILAKFRDLPVFDYDYKDGPKALFSLPESRTGPMAQDYSRLFADDSPGNTPSTIDFADAVGKLIVAVKALDERTRSDETKDSK